MIWISVVELLALLGVAGLRRRVVGRGPGRALMVVVAVTGVALVVGTLSDVSGVALGLPLTAAAAVVVGRSPWRIGDLAFLSLAAAAATAGAYQMAAILDPDTGSYGDQAALAMAVISAVLVLGASIGAAFEWSNDRGRPGCAPGGGWRRVPSSRGARRGP